MGFGRGKRVTLIQINTLPRRARQIWREKLENSAQAHTK
jgi:hypothetical protein